MNISIGQEVEILHHVRGFGGEKGKVIQTFNATTGQIRVRLTSGMEIGFKPEEVKVIN